MTFRAPALLLVQLCVLELLTGCSGGEQLPETEPSLDASRGERALEEGDAERNTSTLDSTEEENHPDALTPNDTTSLTDAPSAVGGAGGTSPSAPAADGEVIQWGIVVGISDYPPLGPDANDLFHGHDDAIDWFEFLVSRGYERRNVLLFGDSNLEAYPKYDGAAYKQAVLEAIVEVGEAADADDVIAFATSGHGFGDGLGQAALMMMDGSASWERDMLHDTELAAAFSNTTARVFLFIDHCFSGGLGPELMALPNAENIYVATACSERGLGYDGDENGAWTEQFLAGYQAQFAEDDVNVETVFDWAAGSYAYQPPSPDAPMSFDGEPSQRFWLWDGLESPSATAARRLVAPAGSTAAGSALECNAEVTKAELSVTSNGQTSPVGSLADVVRGATLATSHTGRLGTEGESRSRTVELELLLSTIDATQPLSSRASRCWLQHQIYLSDATGREVGVLGVCQDTGDSLAQPGVFVPTGSITRYGLTIPDRRELLAILRG